MESSLGGNAFLRYGASTRLECDTVDTYNLCDESYIKELSNLINTYKSEWSGITVRLISERLYEGCGKSFEIIKSCLLEFINQFQAIDQYEYALKITYDVKIHKYYNKTIEGDIIVSKDNIHFNYVRVKYNVNCLRFEVL